MIILFAFMDDMKTSIMEFVHNCLLVAGAFLVGYILGGIVGWALGKYAFKQKSTDTMKQLGRPIGGVLLAFIVALLLFTGGLGRKGKDGGDGKGTPADTGTKDPKSKEPDHKSDPKIAVPTIDPSKPELIVRVTVLAGAAVKSERKYYLIDDDSTHRTLDEVKESITSRKAKVTGKTVLQVLFPTDPNFAPPRRDFKVTDLTRWASEEAGLDVVFPASK